MLKMYRESVIILILFLHEVQSMRDQDIASEIGMAIATYRRHKKVMKESAYYHTLDLNRLNDKDYLDQHEGNYSF